MIPATAVPGTVPRRTGSEDRTHYAIPGFPDSSRETRTRCPERRPEAPGGRKGTLSADQGGLWARR